ncbi:MAG: TPM domain-containing protein, partial [Hyphomicrobiales bacterium]|nr:TPM domain-containing protein [Hyphomicrobiales bacterium]
MVRPLRAALAAFALVFAFAFSTAALAATAFPALGGRVVDDAHVLSPATAAALTDKLKALEDKSGIQFVVATVPSLGGQDI